MSAGRTYRPLASNPRRNPLVKSCITQTPTTLTSLHSVLVRRLYFSGLSLLHRLHTRQPKTFLYVWSISIDWHSTHFGFMVGSRKRATRVYQTYERRLCTETEQLALRGSRFCIALCRSRSFSFARSCSSTSFPSSTRNPPLELTIFERSYSKYFPNRESRLNLAAVCGAVVEAEVTGTTSIARLPWLLGVVDGPFPSSRWRCLAFARCSKSADHAAKMTNEQDLSHL